MKSYKSMILETRLKDLVTVGLNMKDADMWITRKGSIETVGKPVKEFSKQLIGIKVVRTDMLNADFLYYAILNMFNQGYFKTRATGTIRLVNIKVQDVKDIKIG